MFVRSHAGSGFYLLSVCVLTSERRCPRYRRKHQKHKYCDNEAPYWLQTVRPMVEAQFLSGDAASRRGGWEHMCCASGDFGMWRLSRLAFFSASVHREVADVRVHSIAFNICWLCVVCSGPIAQPTRVYGNHGCYRIASASVGNIMKNYEKKIRTVSLISGVSICLLAFNCAMSLEDVISTVGLGRLCQKSNTISAIASIRNIIIAKAKDYVGDSQHSKHKQFKSQILYTGCFEQQRQKYLESERPHQLQPMQET